MAIVQRTHSILQQKSACHQSQRLNECGPLENHSPISIEGLAIVLRDAAILNLLGRTMHERAGARISPDEEMADIVESPLRSASVCDRRPSAATRVAQPPTAPARAGDAPAQVRRCSGRSRDRARLRYRVNYRPSASDPWQLYAETRNLDKANAIAAEVQGSGYQAQVVERPDACCRSPIPMPPKPARRDIIRRRTGRLITTTILCRAGWLQLRNCTAAGTPATAIDRIPITGGTAAVRGTAATGPATTGAAAGGAVGACIPVIATGTTAHADRGTHYASNERHSQSAHHMYHAQHASAGHHSPGHHAAARHASNASSAHRGTGHRAPGLARPGIARPRTMRPAMPLAGMPVGREAAERGRRTPQFARTQRGRDITAAHLDP